MKNTVKLFGIIAIVAVITFAFAMVACDNGGGTHTHQWGAWAQTTAPTCTTAGVETQVCDLDATHTETRAGAAIDPNAHTIAGTYRCSGCNEAYNLGDTGPGGGKIFYRLEAGFTHYANAADTVGTTAYYLEAAPDNLSSGLAWASSAYIPPAQGGTGAWVSIGTGTAIGTGRKNTALILATDADAPAAKACDEYTNSGKTDWFLPSRYELNELYTNRASVGNMGTSWYWSSSEVNSSTVYGQNFSNSTVGGNGKNNTTSTIRAVRAF
jgi:hypothetical protein